MQYIITSEKKIKKYILKIQHSHSYSSSFLWSSFNSLLPNDFPHRRKATTTTTTNQSIIDKMEDNPEFSQSLFHFLPDIA